MEISAVCGCRGRAVSMFVVHSVLAHWILTIATVAIEKAVGVSVILLLRPQNHSINALFKKSGFYPSKHRHR